jgi:hypothetical protein
MLLQGGTTIAFEGTVIDRQKLRKAQSGKRPHTTREGHLRYILFEQPFTIVPDRSAGPLVLAATVSKNFPKWSYTNLARLRLVPTQGRVLAVERFDPTHGAMESVMSLDKYTFTQHMVLMETGNLVVQVYFENKRRWHEMAPPFSDYPTLNALRRLRKGD